MAGDKLEKLRQERKAIDARIRLELNRENERKRKDDTRRKILAGAAVLDEASRHPAYREELYKLLNRFLVRAEDRALVGLEPLAHAEGKEGANPSPADRGNY
jgi:hypothetical protein